MFKWIEQKALLTVTAVIGVGCTAGCGGPSADEQIRTSLTDFERSVRAKSYPHLCQKLLAKRIIQQAEQIGLPCEQALRTALETVRQPTLTVRKIAVQGDNATALVRSTAQGQRPSTDTIKLVKEDNTWRIAKLSES